MNRTSLFCLLEAFLLDADIIFAFFFPHSPSFQDWKGLFLESVFACQICDGEAKRELVNEKAIESALYIISVKNKRCFNTYREMKSRHHHDLINRKPCTPQRLRYRRKSRPSQNPNRYQFLCSRNSVTRGIFDRKRISHQGWWRGHRPIFLNHRLPSPQIRTVFVRISRTCPSPKPVPMDK